jgi:hypothetical protein
MLIRISLIVAIIAALGAGTLGYFEVSQQIPTLTQQRDDQTKAKHFAMDQLSKTNKMLVQTKVKLAQTEQDLADAQAQRDKAVADATTQTQRANDLNDKLTQVTQDRDDAKSQLNTYTVIGLTPDQIIKLSREVKDDDNTIAAMTDERGILMRTIGRLTNELAQLTTPDADVKLPADLRGKIVVVDPKWNFVVVDVGEEQGVIKNGELLVSRDGKLVSKVVIRDVEKDRSIANLVPGWTFGPVVEGDKVSPAHPAPPT